MKPPAFRPSSLSYGAFDPSAVAAVADLVVAGTGAGVAVGQAVRRGRTKKKRKGRKGRKRRKAPSRAPAAPVVMTAPARRGETPAWMPYAFGGALVLVAGVLIWKRTKQTKKRPRAQRTSPSTPGRPRAT